MKEVKKTTSAKTASKKNVPNKQMSNKPAPKKPMPPKNKDIRNTAPVVKEVKTVIVDDNKEQDDKKLIVIIAVAILVIIATTIGLLVGCEKKEEKEPTKKKDDVVEPVKKDDEEEVIVKKTTTSSSNKVEYRITYLYKTSTDKKFNKYSVNIKSGKKVSLFVPLGYEDCKYYSNSSLTKTFNFKKVPTSNTKVYMSCKLIEHGVTYKDASGNVLLSETVKGKNNFRYVVGSGNDACPAGDNVKFLGWSIDRSTTIKYRAGNLLKLTKDIELTPVCGVTTVTYKNVIKETPSEEPTVDPEEEQIAYAQQPVIDTEATVDPATQEVVIGYDETGTNGYTLPVDPTAVGLETPTYFVPTQTAPDATNKVRTVVGDDKEILEDTEIKIGDIKNTPEWYTPTISDNVEEKDYEFIGWTETEQDPITKEDVEVEVKSEDNWKPKTGDDAENELHANWDVQAEDAVEPEEL